MTSHGDPEFARHAVEELVRSSDRILLAVSGGLDSMVLLHLAARQVDRRQRLVVASFDHRTGASAAEAFEFVKETAAGLQVAFVGGQAAQPAEDESTWRDQRWRFLRRAATKSGATVIATAHTRDDHLETVVFRTMRGSGARGLAGLLVAPSGIARPLVRSSRQSLESIARAEGLKWVDDPSNLSSRHARNRIRRDLLPAIRAVRPNIDAELLAIAERAATLRQETDDLARVFVRVSADGRPVIDARKLGSLDRNARAHLWPALLAPFGVVLDRRGIDRLAEWSRPAGSIPLSGGFQVVAHREEIRILREPGALHPRTLPAEGEVQFGPWRFTSRVEGAVAGPGRGEVWSAFVESSAHTLVRAWQPGDRLRRGGQSPRRVKRFLAEAGIPDAERRGWPVLVTEGEIVWIPGASRAHAAPNRPGRPMRLITCERIGS